MSFLGAPSLDNRQPPSEGSVGTGCLLGCLCQIGFVLLSLTATVSLGNNRWGFFAWASWGLTQWIALIPVIRIQRAKEHHATVQGLLIAGSLGVLLCSACAAMGLGSK